MFKIRTVVVSLATLIGVVAVTACNPAGAPAQFAPCNVGIVGDSLTVGMQTGNRAVNELAARGCGVSFIDARVGRPTAEGAGIIEAKAAAGQLPSILVVALGTNDSANPTAFAQNIDRVMVAAGGRPVVWINIDHAATEASLNPQLLDAQKRYPKNLWILDWNSFADLNPGLKAADQIHLTGAGYSIRAQHLAVLVAEGR